MVYGNHEFNKKGFENNLINWRLYYDYLFNGYLFWNIYCYFATTNASLIIIWYSK